MSVPPSEMAQEMEEDHPPAVEALNIDDTSLGIVLNLVGLHLSCRDLIRLQLVSKEWQKLCSETAPSLWTARKRDNVPDWYFPTGLVPHEETLLSPRYWYGIHHPSGMGHRLPGLEFLDLGRNWRVEVLTGEGGLLLLYAECEMERVFRLVRSNMCEIGVKKGCAEDRVPSKRLIVCNPLTKRWRALSEMDQSIPIELKHLYHALLRFVERPVDYFDRVKNPSKDDTCLVAIHIVENNESSSYEIVIIWETQHTSNNYMVAVYDSGMDQWEASTSPKYNEFTLGSVCLNRRIYLLEQVGNLHVVAKVFLVDSRTWLPDDYTLFDKEMYIDAYIGGRRTETGPGPTLVACSGDIYAIVPVTVREEINMNHGSERWLRWRRLPRRTTRVGDRMYFQGFLRFDLFKLQEEQKQFTFCKALPFKVRMTFKVPPLSWNDRINHPGTCYRCASQGSVIWVAYEDLLVQFDVVTGSCKTRKLLFNAFDFWTAGLPVNFMPYEPNFCAEP